MKRRNKYNQGIFKPKNISKYKGSSPIIYRSGLELKYMRWLDENRHIVSWGSESVVLPYVKPTDGKIHKYFLDFNFRIKDKQGNIKKFIVEVKPAKQCNPPKKTGRKKPTTLIKEQITYATNCSKWEAAKQWAKKNGYNFIIVTEKDIQALK